MIPVINIDAWVVLAVGFGGMAIAGLVGFYVYLREYRANKLRDLALNTQQESSDRP